MPHFIRIALAFALLAMNGIASESRSQEAKQDQVPTPPFRIAGYLPDYRLAEYDYGRTRSLTDLILFSAEPSADGSLDLTRLKNAPWQQLKKLKTEQRIRLILCIGGWDRSTHFPVLVSTAERRETFAKNLVAFCLQERFDGVDIDWEHPETEEEERDYERLLEKIKAEFQPHGLTLTVTMAGWQHLPKSAFQHVDWVNLMAYDHPGKHSTFDGMKEEVEKILNAGCPKQKLVVGIPLYGRDTSKPEKAIAYAELLSKYRLAPDRNEVEGFFFNGPKLIEAKTDFAKQKQLGGVMVWELGHDAEKPNSLVDLIRTTADKF